jgi:hypothetical protein
MAVSRDTRDLMIAGAAAAAAIGTLLSGGAALLTLVDVIRTGLAPSSYTVGKGFDIAHDAMLAAGFMIVTFAFLTSIERRERTLAVGAVVAGGGFTALIIAEALYATSEPRHTGPLVTRDVLSALAATLLLAAASACAVAFSRASSAPTSSQAHRDSFLGLATIVLSVAFALATAASILLISATRTPGDTGLWIATTGSWFAFGGAMVAAVAFFSSRHEQRRVSARWFSRRERLLAAAFAVFVVGFLLGGLGDAITAHDSSGPQLPGLLTTAHWLEAVSGFTMGGGAALASAGFFISRRP